MKNLTWQNPEQLFVAQELINKVKSKCCGIKVYNISILLDDYLCHSSLFALISLVEMSYGGLPIQSWKEKVGVIETLRFTSFRSE